MILLLILFLLLLIWLVLWLLSRPRSTMPVSPAAPPSTEHPQEKKMRAIEVITHYYIFGKLKAKYWAESAADYSAADREQTREIHINEAEIFSDYHTIAGAENQSRLKERFEQQPATFASPLPDPLPTTVVRDGVTERYQLKFDATKVFDFTVFDIQHEGKESFGTIEGQLIGRIKKVTTKWEEEEAPAMTDAVLTEPVADRAGGISQLKSFGTILYERTRLMTSVGKTWSGWKVSRTNAQPTGCWSVVILVISVIVFVFFALVFLGLLVAIVRAIFR